MPVFDTRPTYFKIRYMMLSPTYYLLTVISPNFGGNLIADRKLFFLYIEKFVDSYFAQKFGDMTIPMTTSEKVAINKINLCRKF